MSRNEPELLLLLSPGDPIEAQDKQTGHRWQGTVNIVAPEQDPQCDRGTDRILHTPTCREAGA
jgi:hypothetical protein